MNAPRALRHEALRVEHAFGTRGLPEPEGLWRPRQVHGAGVVVLDAVPKAPLGEADAVVSSVPGLRVGVVTADCVPVLVSQGSVVAAIHAGWRGLACGVIESALEVMDRRFSPSQAGERIAVIGPHICARHYEIDAPVREALEARNADALPGALRKTRPAHWTLDLRELTRGAFRRAGWMDPEIFSLPDTCTYGDSRRFASRRRDGPGGERLIHWIAPPGPRSA